MTTKTSLEIEVPAGQPVMTFRRFLKAPPSLVFESFTNCEHLARWWGPRRMTLAHCETDLRVGGKYRFVLRSEEGFEAEFYGEYREVERSSKLSNTWIYGGAPEHAALETAEFVEVDGGTMVLAMVTHDSVESRDMHLASGMESGATESYERLDELLDEIQRPVD